MVLITKDLGISMSRQLRIYIQAEVQKEYQTVHERRHTMALAGELMAV